MNGSPIDEEQAIRLLPKPPRTLQEAMDGFRRAVTSSEHNSIAEALTADLLDVIPIVGDVANAIRVGDSLSRMDRKRNIRTLMQFVDTVVGIVPGIGEIADLITPTNTIYYIASRTLPTPEEFMERILPPLPKLPAPPPLRLPRFSHE